MAILSGGPISSLPVSGSASAAAATDDTVPTQITSFEDSGYYGDTELEAYDSSDAQLMAPLEDTAVVLDATVFTFTGFYDLVTDDDADGYQPDWSQGPPTDQFDETGQTTGLFSNNDWVDEDEPIADGHFSTPPDSDDEYVRPPSCAALQDCGGLFDEDDTLTDGFFSTPLDDAPVATVDDVGQQELGQVWDDDEPVTDGWLQTVVTDQFDETGETTGRSSFADLWDDDEPVTDGWSSSPFFFDEDAPFQASYSEVTDDDEPVTEGYFSSPADEPVATVDDVGEQELGQVWDDDEPVTDGWLQVVATDQFDETGETAGQQSFADIWDDDEPIADGWFSTPPDQDDQPPTLALLGEIFDDDEPVTDGWFSPATPDDLQDEVGTQELGQIYDDDEPVTDGFLMSPSEDIPTLTDDIPNTLLGEIFDDDEPVTDGWLCAPLEDQPPLVDDISDTSFPADDDLEGEEFHPDFFSGFTLSPLEDTPVSATTPGLWYDLKKKRRKKLEIPAWEDEETVDDLVQEVVEAVQEVVEAPSIATQLLGTRGHNKPLPVPVIRPAGFVPMDTQGWTLLISGVLQSRSIAEAEARNEAIRNEVSRRAADILLREEVAKWKKFVAEFHAARDKRERDEEIMLINAIWEMLE